MANLMYVIVVLVTFAVEKAMIVDPHIAKSG